MQVEFEKPVYVTGIVVYEYEFAGATSKISAYNGESWVPLFEATSVKKLGKMRVFIPHLKVHFSFYIR